MRFRNLYPEHTTRDISNKEEHYHKFPNGNDEIDYEYVRKRNAFLIYGGGTAVYFLGYYELFFINWCPGVNQTNCM